MGLPAERRTVVRPDLRRISDVVWDLPKSFKAGMAVPVRIIATETLVRDMDLQVFDQITNVATLPGIRRYAFCMPDGHSGYGFPIGGVAAFDVREGGVISPGGIGFDINCGMRLVLTNLTFNEVKPRLRELVDSLFRRVPAGVGSRGFVRLSKEEFRDKVVTEGARWAVRSGFGWEEDLERTELGGRAGWADGNAVSSRAVERGFDQIGTLGSGNHYLEVQRVLPGNIRDPALAKKWGLFADQIVVMFHCGSRGFGHQVATDHLLRFLSVMERKYGIRILDRELACAPFHSPEGQDYYRAMGAAVNMSFANRQVILHRIREVFAGLFGRSAGDLGMHMVFDIAHNRGSLEQHEVNGGVKELLVHRKGATGCYPAGREEVPERYRDDGSPVIIGGSMETGSYLLVAGPNAGETFCSTAHGSGRTMSRSRAKRLVNGRELVRRLEERGIYVRSVSYPGVAEEAGFAYKSIDDVVEATAAAGISLPVVKLVPVGNVKG
jgi:tRNA-splicing ligase RtcB